MNFAEPPAIELDADGRAARALCADRETLIVGFDTDAAALRALLPAALEPDGSATALAEFAAMPDPSGGSRTEFNLLIPALHGAQRVLYRAYSTPDEGGRPRASMRLVIVHDTLTGILEMHGRPVAIAAMNYRRADALERRRAFGAMAPADTARQFGPLRVAAAGEGEMNRLVAQPWRDVRVQCAWTGPATLDLLWPAASPLAALPVNRMHGGLHCVIDFRREPAHPLGAVASPEPDAAVAPLAAEGLFQPRLARATSSRAPGVARCA